MLQMLVGDCRKLLATLPDQSVHCCVTSPPYWGLRDYGHCDQIGLEATPQDYVETMRGVFAEVRRVLRDDGTLWLNLGPSYAGGGCGGGGSFASERPGWSVFGDNAANRFPRSEHVPACDIGGTKPLSFPGSDRACPDCGGVLTACSLNRHAHSAGTHQLIAPDAQRTSRKVRGTERPGSVATSPSSSAGASDPSTTSASRPSVLDASCHADAALESQREIQTSPGDALGSERKPACIRDTVQSDHPLDARTTGTVFVCTACGYSTRTHPAFKPKDMVPVPWMVAMALQADGWYLRSDIIWSKPNPMPESVTDRPTKAHEYLFLLSKREKYWYDAEAIRENWTCDRDDMREKGVRTGLAYLQQDTVASNHTKPRHSDKQRGHSRRHAGFNDRWDAIEKADQQANGRNKRTVWTVATCPYPEAHFATYPPDLIKPCILAGCPVGGTVLDPFGGSGTTGMVALELGRRAILIELNEQYAELAKQRCDVTPGLPL